MNAFSLDAAELINTTMRLVALAAIYSEQDKATAAAHITREALNPDLEPQERAALLAIIALLETN